MALEWGEWSAARPGRNLPPGKTRYPLYRRLGGPHGRSGQVENLIPNGIWTHTVQPVVSPCTDWSTQPTITTKCHCKTLIAAQMQFILKVIQIMIACSTIPQTMTPILEAVKSKILYPILQLHSHQQMPTQCFDLHTYVNVDRCYLCHETDKRNIRTCLSTFTHKQRVVNHIIFSFLKPIRWQMLTGQQVLLGKTAAAYCTV